MQSEHEEFARRGVEVVAISFVKPQRLKQYLKSQHWTIRVLSDPDRIAYRVFGLQSVPWRRLLRPQAIREYLKPILHGRFPRFPREDVHQLGGDFLIETDGRVVRSYRSEDPTDRPAVAELLEAVASMKTNKE